MTDAAQRRTGLVREFRCATTAVRLLVLTQLAFNVGFFMVLPYLSVHLSSDLGQATAVVGVVLGLRSSYQRTPVTPPPASTVWLVTQAWWVPRLR